MAWLSEKQLQSFRSVGRGVKISDQAIIYGAENVEIGDNVRIDAHTIILASSGSLRIGSHVHIAVQCLLSCNGGIVLGDFTDISMGAKLISASDDASGENLVGPIHPEHLTKVHKAPIVMEDYAWVGTNGVLMPGVCMMQGAMLGVNGAAMHNYCLGPWSIYIGHPARRFRERSRDMISKADQARSLWDSIWQKPANG